VEGCEIRSVLVIEALHGHDGHVLLAAVVQGAGELAAALSHLLHSLDNLVDKFLLVETTAGSTKQTRYTQDHPRKIFYLYLNAHKQRS
jgi:hypothetical protein